MKIRSWLIKDALTTLEGFITAINSIERSL
jgi:hypothetical protein